MEVIVMKVEREASSTMVAGLIRPGIGPLASDGLDEALDLAVSLGSVRFSEGVFET
jgi:hypothetical protein